jgi:hypothetical protein
MWLRRWQFEPIPVAHLDQQRCPGLATVPPAGVYNDAGRDDMVPHTTLGEANHRQWGACLGPNFSPFGPDSSWAADVYALLFL